MDKTKIKNLQALICSDRALSHHVFYDFLCSGLESGNFKHTTPMGVTTISDLCTPSEEHEAAAHVERKSSCGPDGTRGNEDDVVVDDVDEKYWR